MPKMDGMELLEKSKDIAPELPFIMISGHGTMETAVEATKKGAFDFVNKPPDLNKLLITVRNAVDKNNLVIETKVLKRQITKTREIVGDSPSIKKIKQTIENGVFSITPKRNNHFIIVITEYFLVKDLTATKYIAYEMLFSNNNKLPDLILSVLISVLLLIRIIEIAPTNPIATPIILVLIIFSFIITIEIIKTIIGEIVEIIELFIGVDNSKPLIAEIIFTDIPNTVQNKNFDQSFFSIFSCVLNIEIIQNRVQAPKTLENSKPEGVI